MKDRPIRVLLVDDDEDDYILTQALLADVDSSEIILEWQDDDAVALDEMRRNRYDVYLLDYRLGNADGLAMLRNGIALGCKRPIIMLTGQGDHAVDLEAMQAGAADYLVKAEINGPLLERSIRYSIQQKKNQIELAEMQQRLADSREEERLHLAHELHDGPLQELLGILFHLGAISHGQEPEQWEDQVVTVQNQLKYAIDSIRNICRELRPPSLAPFGLEKAIRAHAILFKEQYPQIDLQLDLDEDQQLLPERVRLALYRIYQHALFNVAKHAGATQARVSFRMGPHEIRLRIADDGKGFAVPPDWIFFARRGYLGLLGSHERAEVIGGNLYVRSEPDMGTIVTVAVPTTYTQNHLAAQLEDTAANRV